MNLSALAAILIALELAARLLFAQWGPTIGGERTTFCDYDAELGWSHRPGFEATFSRRDFSVHVSINPDGQRDTIYPLGRSDAQRMLVLGDSFGWGYGVEHQDRFDEVLESRHANWEIINTSVSGYGTDQQLIYLRTRGLAYKPDVVLLLLYSNDFANNSAAAQYYTNKPYFILQGEHLELRNTPVPRPYLLQRMAHLIGQTYILGRAMQGAIALIRSLSAKQIGLHGDRRSDASYPLTRRLIHEIDSLSRSIGARFVLVSIPMDMARRNALAEQAEQSGFPYLALDETFANGGGGLTFPHDDHWNSQGHRVAANALEEFLLERGLMTAAAL